MNYNNLGLVYIDLGAYATAEEYLNRSLQIIDSLGITPRATAINISFGKLYQTQKKYDIAIDYFSKIIQSDMHDNADKTELLRDAHKGLSECYDLTGQYQKTVSHYKDFQHFNQLIFDRDKQASIFENQILYEKNAHKEEIKLIQEKNKIQKKYNRIYIVLLCIGILLLSLFIILLRLRNKSIRQKVHLIESNHRIQQLEIENTKALNEKLHVELREKDQLRKIEELELQQLKDTIDYKNRELTSSAIHVSNKNEILSQISSTIKSITDWEENAKLKELNMIIKRNFQLDQDWDIFKKHFIEVHPNFFKTVIHRYPDLTNDDLKLCAYLKLQLSSKEIARLLNIETSAVNKRRNRLRKKMSLESSIDLHEFMIKIDDATL